MLHKAAKKLKIVIDFKYYHSPVKMTPIFKLIHDAEIRQTEEVKSYPLLIAGQATDLSIIEKLDLPLQRNLTIA